MVDVANTSELATSKVNRTNLVSPTNYQSFEMGQQQAQQQMYMNVLRN